MANGDSPEDKSLNLQFDYAWKWFSFHAEQRTKMFGFMLTLLGLFTAAIATAVEKEFGHNITITLCICAVVIAVIFWRLDSRNGQLLKLGEDVLSDLEKRCIFKDRQIEDRAGKSIQFGILWRQAVEDRSRGCHFVRTIWEGRHRIWMPGVCFLICVFFFVVAVWALLTLPSERKRSNSEGQTISRYAGMVRNSTNSTLSEISRNIVIASGRRPLA